MKSRYPWKFYLFHFSCSKRADNIFWKLDFSEKKIKGIFRKVVQKFKTIYVFLQKKIMMFNEKESLIFRRVSLSLLRSVLSCHVRFFQIAHFLRAQTIFHLASVQLFRSTMFNVNSHIFLWSILKAIYAP